MRPIMEYADVFWDGCTDSERDIPEHAQCDAAKLVCGAIKGTSKQSVLPEVGLETIKARRIMHKLGLFNKIINGLLPCESFYPYID